jgi:hypothetical protein
MTEPAQDKGWSPYLAGALTGVVLVLSVYVAGQYFGTSTSFVRTMGLLENSFAHEHLEHLDYFRAIVPRIDWQWMFVLGILLGGFISAITDRSFKVQATPDMWQQRFGPGRIDLRSVVAFTGGMVALIGARIAGG